MARLFISHASADNAAAIALNLWLSENGFDDVFLDIDPVTGLVAGDRWQEALKTAADRCEAVLFVVSSAWLASRWCLAEFLLAKTLRKRIIGLLIEAVPLDRLPPEMTSEWQMCDLSGGERQRSFHVDAPEGPACIAFRETGLDRLRRGLLRSGLEGRSFPWPPPDEAGRAPYRGLKALEPQDAAIFFGRDAATVRGMDQIRGLAEGGLGALLVILGASGAGKSSFLRAGLWPRLARDDIAFLPLPVIRPEASVLSGASGLAASLASAFARLGAPRARGDIKQALATEADALPRLLHALLRLARQRLQVGQGIDTDPLIVLGLDQAEELFAPDGIEEAERFLGLIAPLLARGAQPRVLLVLTIRSDRYAELQAAPALEGIRQDLFSLPPMPAVDFKSVIEGPARRASEAGRKLDIASALTTRLIEEAQGADALPLLGFTLERLFDEYGQSAVLTLAQYEALGGGAGVLEAAVAAALAEPGRDPAIPAGSEAQLALLRTAFIPWLARIDPASRTPRRRVAALAELPKEAQPVVARLVSARLLVTDHRDGADLVEVAHESLLRHWPALKGWLEEDAVDLALLDGFERAAADWERSGGAEDWLDHRGPRLGEAERVLAREDFSRRLDPVASAYLSACRAHEAAARAERRAAARRLLQRTQLGLAAALVLLIFAGLGAWYGLAGQRAFRDQYEAAERARLRNLALALKGEPNPNVVQRVAADMLPRGSAPATRNPELLDRLMATANGNLERLVLAHTNALGSALFSPDGSWIVTASSEGTARVWDAASGRLLSVLHGQNNAVSDAVFDPGGHYVATASSDHTVHIWDWSNGSVLRVLVGHDGPIRHVRYSPDGRRLVTASTLDGTIRVWDAQSGTAVFKLGDGASRPETAQYSPDGGRILAGYEDGTVRLWNAADGALLKVFTAHHAIVSGMAISPDGKQFATASADNTAKVWDTESLALVTTLTGHSATVFDIAYSPEGGRIATASNDKTIRLWDSRRGVLLETIVGSEDSISKVAFSPDGRSLVTASADYTARVWQVADRATVGTLVGHDSGLQSAVFTPDGRSILTASPDGTSRLWDAASGTLQKSLPDHGVVVSAAASPDGTRFVAAGSFGGTIWDAARGTPIAALNSYRDTIYSAVFSADNQQILTASLDGTARLWVSASGAPIKTIFSSKEQLVGAAFSPDGKRVAVARSGGTVQIIDKGNGQVLANLLGHNDTAYYPSFSPDGRSLLTVSNDKTARLWNAKTGEPLKLLVGHDEAVNRAAFSPDGRLVATASDDRTARIWDAATGTELAILTGHTSEVNCVAFSPDGQRLVTASEDKTARIWNVPHYLGPGDLSFVRAVTSSVIDETLRARYALSSPPPTVPAPAAQCGATGEMWPRALETPITLAAWTTGAQAGNGACHQRLAEHFGDGSKPGLGVAHAFFHHALAARLLEAQGDAPGAQHARYRREALAWVLPRQQAEALMDAAEDWKPGQAFPKVE